MLQNGLSMDFGKVQRSNDTDMLKKDDIYLFQKKKKNHIPYND